jgi:hypothetical protein
MKQKVIPPKQVEFGEARLKSFNKNKETESFPMGKINS